MLSSMCVEEMLVSADQDEEIDDLWFLLHHSEEDDRLVLGLTSYYDDSGSDDGSRLVTIGGPAMSRIQFKEFSKRWARMLARHRIEPPLHISDFVGMGKYAGWYPEFKRSLFLDVSRLINEHKLYSFSVAVPQAEFKGELGEDVRRVTIGPYAFAFFSAVIAHQHISAKLKAGPLKNAYMLDCGFGYQQQLFAAHAVIVNNETLAGGFRHTGALAFSPDDSVPALQAADAIAWASRKRELNGSLPVGFEPLNEASNT